VQLRRRAPSHLVDLAAADLADLVDRVGPAGVDLGAASRRPRSASSTAVRGRRRGCRTAPPVSHDSLSPTLTARPRSAKVASMITQEALNDLLCDLFVDASQLRRFIRHGEQGEAILRELPGAAVSLAELVDRAVGELFRRGLVAAALERLRAELPLRHADINRVANSMPRAASSATSTGTGFPTAASVPLSAPDASGSAGAEPTTQPDDVALLIALEEEWKVLRLIAGEPRGVKDAASGRYLYRFEVSSAASRPYRCVAVCMDDMGPGQATDATHVLLQTQPRTLVNLGIAAAIHDDLKLCDVVVADQVDDYLATAKAVSKGKKGWSFELRGSVYKPTYSLVQDVKNMEGAHPEAFAEWRTACAAAMTERAEKLVGTRKAQQIGEAPALARVHLASGPVLAASEDFSKWVRTRDGLLKALEMEAAGMMLAAHQQSNQTSTLVLRGISDFGDSRKSKTDKKSGGAFRYLAMFNTTQLLWAMMRWGLLPRHESRHRPEVLAAAGLVAKPAVHHKVDTGLASSVTIEEGGNFSGSPMTEPAVKSPDPRIWTNWWMNTNPKGETLTIVDDEGKTITLRPWEPPVKLSDKQAFSPANDALAHWRGDGQAKMMRKHPWDHVTSVLYRHEHNSVPRILIFRSMGSPPALLKYGQTCYLTREDVELEDNELIRRYIVEEKLVRIKSEKDPTMEQRRYSAELLALGIGEPIDLGITAAIPGELDMKTGKWREFTAEEAVASLVKDNKRASEFGLEVPLLDQDTNFDFLKAGGGLVTFTYQEYSDVRCRALTPEEARLFARHSVASGVFSNHREFPGGLFVGALLGDTEGPPIPQCGVSPHVKVFVTEAPPTSNFEWQIIAHNFSTERVQLERASISWRFRDLGAAAKYPIPQPGLVGMLNPGEKREMEVVLPFDKIQEFAIQQGRSDPMKIEFAWIYAVLELDLRLALPSATSFRLYRELPAGPDPLRDRRKFLSALGRPDAGRMRNSTERPTRRLGPTRKYSL